MRTAGKGRLAAFCRPVWDAAMLPRSTSEAAPFLTVTTLPLQAKRRSKSPLFSHSCFPFSTKETPLPIYLQRMFSKLQIDQTWDLVYYEQYPSNFITQQENIFLYYRLKVLSFAFIFPKHWEKYAIKRKYFQGYNQYNEAFYKYQNGRIPFFSDK